MTDNRNTILAVILSGIVLIAWQYFYNMPQMERQRTAQQAQSELAKTQPQAANPAAPAAPAVPIVARDAAIASSPRVKIDTPRLTGSIALRGGRIDDLSLVQFRETVDPNSPPIVLFSPSNT